jgi:hypothetical protein
MHFPVRVDRKISSTAAAAAFSRIPALTGPTRWARLAPGRFNRGMAMGNVEGWILKMANQSVGRWIGWNFTNLAEIGVPFIILGGMIAAWMVFRPRPPKY